MQIRFKSQSIFSTHWWLLLIASLSMSALTVSLGFWQLNRAEFKEAAFAKQQAQAALPPVTHIDLIQGMNESQGLQRQVHAEGEWLAQWTVFLDNRTMQGQPGFWVLTPLQLKSGEVILVQRGWAPRDRTLSDKLPPVQTPAGQVIVHGRWVQAPSKMIELAPSSAQTSAEKKVFQSLRQNLTIEEFEKDTGLKVLATVMEEAPPSEGLSCNWPTILSGSEKNRAYALQWFVLAALSAGLFLWFQIIQKIRHD
jgi:surfeit locus 1 family protein